MLALVVGLAVLVAAQMAAAAPVPSQTTCATAAPETQPVAAERDLVKGRLMDFGLTDEEAASRVELLSDQEVHAVAADLEAIRAAGAVGDERWDTTTVLLLLILVAILAS